METLTWPEEPPAGSTLANEFVELARVGDPAPNRWKITAQRKPIGGWTAGHWSAGRYVQWDSAVSYLGPATLTLADGTSQGTIAIPAEPDDDKTLVDPRGRVWQRYTDGWARDEQAMRYQFKVLLREQKTLHVR